MKYVKIFLSLLLVFIFSGCQNTVFNINEKVNNAINEAISEPILKPKFNSKYYSYYIEPSIGRIQNEEYGNILLYNDTRIIMNLNISQIIGGNYYENRDNYTNPNLDVVYQASGMYVDFNEIEHPYNCLIYDTNGKYLVTMQSDVVRLYSICNLYDTSNIAKQMLKICRGFNANKALIINDFSNKQTISYSRKQVELFQNIVPENGSIEELLSTVTNVEQNEVDGGTISQEFYATDNYPDDQFVRPQEVENTEGEQEYQEETYSEEQ